MANDESIHHLRIRLAGMVPCVKEDLQPDRSYVKAYRYNHVGVAAPGDDFICQTCNSSWLYRVFYPLNQQ